jgi:beta-lactamase regulating signal transducer with metallopeptidase domain
VDAVVNWLWQGSLVALAAAALLHVIGPARANVRYTTLWIAWLSVLAIPIAPLVWAAAFPSGVSGPVLPVATEMVSIPLDGLWSSVLLALWGSWSVVFAVRILIAMAALRSARTGCRPLPHDREARLRCWVRVGATGRRTRVVLSSSIRSAAVLGTRSPLIAVAPALLETLDDEELDCVVIHEWAHVQRYDDLTHLFQVIGRAIAGWHPALWWIDRQLHLEREVACDETAVSITGSAKGYASCLTRLASLPAPPLRSLPAVGVLSSHGLRARIVRILRFGHDAPLPTRRRRAYLTGVALCALALGVSTTRLVDTTLPAPAPTRIDGLPEPGEITADNDRRRALAPVVVSARHASARPPVSTLRASAPANRGAGASARQQSSEPSLNAAPPVTSRSLDGLSLSIPAARSDLASRDDLSSSRVLESGRNEPDVPSQSDSGNTMLPDSRWSLAADAGKAVGRTSRDKAVATAGFFTRLGRSVARSF